MSLSIPPTHLSFSRTLASPNNPLFLPSNLSLRSLPRKSTVIRMGGGPRTYPGGVSKWQWKRMQAKKAKQLLKARLCRERQIYEMRKRAELKAAVAELERPWEVVEKPPNLFSVNADEQLKVLADRFQRPGGFDLWTDRDGPQLFRTPDGLPSARFFPKGVVHSVKPYGRVEGYGELESGSEDENGDGEISEMGDNLGYGSDSMENSEAWGKLSRDMPMKNRIGPEYGRKGRRRRTPTLPSRKNEVQREEKDVSALVPGGDGGHNRINRTRGRNVDLENMTYNRINRSDGRSGGGDNRTNRSDARIGRRGLRYSKRDSETEVYDMSLHGDGSYGF